ncbi:MAG: hypothetical protein HQK76_19155, partial [Desulfobacterales bacterium]|nr:hypothetical protein [Desulfobacterales bacterium]
MPNKRISTENLIKLHEALLIFPPYSKERRNEILKFSKENDVSEWTVRRQYNEWMSISIEGRKDKGTSKIAPKQEVEYWIIMVAAVQLATLNKKGHMCSTRRAIEILENGITYDDIPFKLPSGKLTISTANRWIRSLKIRNRRKFRNFIPIHFRAEHSNELWQMDVSPSDAKYFGDSIRRDGRKPYIYSVTDDHSGVVYAEYRETRDEDIQAGFEIIYAAMSEKK